MWVKVTFTSGRTSSLFICSLFLLDLELSYDLTTLAPIVTVKPRRLAHRVPGALAAETTEHIDDSSDNHERGDRHWLPSRLLAFSSTRIRALSSAK